MEKEQQKDKIIEIVKKAIGDNSVTTYGADDMVSIDGDDVDNIAEEVAENVIANIESEIEILKIQNKNMGIAFDRLQEEYDKLKRERGEYYAQADRLQAKLAQVLMGVDKTKEWTLDRAKIEGAKEFAEKLKNVIHERDYIQGYAEIGLIEEIDELLKEYTE